MPLNKLLLLLFIFSLTSCFKNTEEFIPDTSRGDIQNLIDLLKSNQPSALIDPAKDNFIVTEDNVVLEIPAGSLVYADGKQVEGSVLVKYSVDQGFAHEIIEGRSTATSASDISSLFSLHFNVSQGKKPVFIDEASHSITVYVPSTQNNDNQNLHIYQWINSTWSDVSDSEAVGSVDRGSWNVQTENGTIFGIGYKLILRQSGDFLIGLAKARTDFIELCVTLPENYTTKNTMAVAVLPKERLVRNLSFTDGKFCSYEINGGAFVKLITLSEQDGKYLVGETSYKSSGKVNLTLVPKEKSLDEIFHLLEGL